MRRRRRTTIGAASGSLAIIWFLLIGCARGESFFVQDAVLAQLPKHQRFLEASSSERSRVDDEFNLAGHRIVSGSGLVLAVRSMRWFPSLVDAASYEKLTIFVPEKSVEGKATVDLQSGKDIIVFYSRGRPAFPEMGCFGYPASGQLSYEFASETEVELTYDFHFKMVSPGRSEEWCNGDLRLKDRIGLRRKRVDSITPWEGSKGTDIYDEANP